MYLRNFLFFVAVCIAVASCDSNRLEEKFKPFEDGNWYYDSLAVFDFEVEDTVSLYNIYYTVRNTMDYPYYNLYTQYELSDSSGKILRSNLHEAELMDVKSGAPFGESAAPKGQGIGASYTHTIPVLMKYQFKHSGKYTFSLNQYMRMDTLAGVYGVGIRIEYDDNK